MICEEFRHVHNLKSRERCGRRAYGYVVSGPMFVCWSHWLHWQAQGEQQLVRTP